MKKTFTLLIAALLCCVGVVKAQTIVGLTEVPQTAVDLSTTELTTGYYLIKQTNSKDITGFLKAASEAADAVVAANGAPTVNAETEAVYIWYVEVAEDGKFSIATANKVAGWQAPTQKQKNLVAYANKATTLELEKDFSSLNQTTQTLIKAYWEEKSCYSYVHASGNKLGSWNDQNTASLFYIEFYAIPESSLIIYDPADVARVALSEKIAQVSATLGALPLQTENPEGAYYLTATQEGDAPISKAIDNNPSTYYGSTWQSTVGSHHYWQVDLGEGVSLSEFTFSYITRANGSDTPTQINVQGSADGEAFNDIVVLTKDVDGLPTAGGSSYTSKIIENSESYRYIRFEVPSTTNNYSAAGNKNQEVTIAIAEFALTNKNEASWSARDKAVKALVDAAQEVLDNEDATPEDVEEALALFSAKTIIYNFTYDGKVIYSQEATAAIGEDWPAITSLPYGLSAVKPEGFVNVSDLVDGKATKTIELTVGELPFKAAASVESISTWYYLQMHSNNKRYIEYLNGESYLAWEDQEVDMNDADKYVWAFVGNVFDGFKLVNKAATTAMAMKSTGSGDATMDTYANGTAFVLAATATGAEGGFCLRYPSNNQYLNAQSGKVNHWDANDAGSTIFATDISAYITSVKEAALATLAQYAASPLIFDQELVKKAIENVNALSDTETSTVNKANAEVAAVIEDAESKTYTFQTKATDNHRSGVWVSANATTGKAIGAHSFDNNAIWSLKIANANTFYIYNRLNKTYIGAPGSNCPLTADPTTAYSLEVVNGTLVELKHNGETLHASNHDDDKLLNWDGDEDASRWYMTFYAMDYEADILMTGNASMIKPSMSSEGTPNAEFETHVVNDQLTIYTSYCHWSEELTLVNKPYKASFYSNKLSKAIKNIRFEASSDKEETLIFYGSNDGEEWTLVETEVTVPCTIEDGIADFTGTAFNYFKVTTKGYNPVSIKKIIIEFDPQVELPVIVDVPSFSVVGGNMYIPAYLRLYAEEGATIYWSTDGKNYKKYTNYIVIDKTCTIYAYTMIGENKSEVLSQTYVMATEYDNIGALLATEATETGIPVIVNLQAIITAMSKQQMTIADNTGELYITDKYIPSHYAVKDSLTGQLSGVYKLIEGVPTVSEISYTLITHKEYTPADFFMIGEATKTLEMDKWYLLKSEGRNAYVNETDKDLRMVSAANYAGVVAMEGNMGMLFKFSESKTEGYYNILSAKGHYFSVAQSSSTISATAVDYIVKNVTGSTFYMQNPANNIVVDANAIGGTFVGWGTTVPTAPGGNNCYQFIEVDLVNADQAESILKAKTMLYDLQQAYGLVTSASQYSSNAVEPTEGALANLLDNDYTTFFHSTWSGTAEDTHYLQAEVSEPTNSIFFYFKKRSQNEANRPTNITILGSNDGVEFTEITTINSGLPTNAEMLDYTSNVITTSESYKYFRFKVNATNNNATEANGNPFFTFSEFYLFPGNSNLIDLMEAAKLFVTVNPTDKYFNELKAAFNALVNTDIYEDDYPALIDEFYEIYNKLGSSEEPTEPDTPTDPDPDTPTDPEDPEVDPEDPEDNPETGINSAENCDKPIVVYTITGKAIQTTVGKLQNLEKGIYIIDGKKKMVK